QQLLRHGTPRKLLNLARAEWALRRGHTELASMPYIYIIDPCNVCNLRCPLCPTGNQTSDRPKKMMALECYEAIIEQVRDYAVERLQRRKRERRSPTPILEWQFLVMRHNEHELEAARGRAEAMGVERFRPISAGLPFDELDNVDLAAQWIADNPAYRGYHPETI